MKSQEITVQFPAPDYAVVLIDGVPIKSFSADTVKTNDKTEARDRMKRDVTHFCDGLGYGYSKAIQSLQATALDMRTKL